MLPDKYRSFYHIFSKRIVDLLLTVPTFIALSPILAAVALMVLIWLGRPVLFKQLRPGLHGEPFTILKFRTMSDARNERDELLSDAQRLTRLGAVLRKTSIDELPELINVLKGDMSLVGPRPLLMEYLEQYTPEQARRHKVKPGITGWAQIHGRNAISWEEKFKFDGWYIDNWSLWLDIKILFITVWRILKREGINHPGYVTMKKFKG